MEEIAKIVISTKAPIASYIFGDFSGTVPTVICSGCFNLYHTEYILQLAVILCSILYARH